MNEYYSKKGKVLGRAWGFRRCWAHFNKPHEHKPHSHNKELYSYGPYMCPGWPEKKIYATKPREALN